MATACGTWKRLSVASLKAGAADCLEPVLGAPCHAVAPHGGGPPDCLRPHGSAEKEEAPGGESSVARRFRGPFRLSRPEKEAIFELLSSAEVKLEPYLQARQLRALRGLVVRGGVATRRAKKRALWGLGASPAS